MNPGIVVSLCVFSQAVEVINDYLVFHRMLWLVKRKASRDFIITKLRKRETYPCVDKGDLNEVTVPSSEWEIKKDNLFPLPK